MVYRSTPRVRARKEAQRARLLDAALELVRAEGFSGLRVADVAAAAGVATGTVYRYFANRGELCAEVFRQASQREVNVLSEVVAGPGAPRERLAAAARVFCERAQAGRRVAYALLAEPVSPAVERERLVYRRAYAELFEGLIEEALAEGSAPSQQAALSAAFLVGALGEALLGSLAAEAPPPERLSSLVELTLRAVFGAGGAP